MTGDKGLSKRLTAVADYVLPDEPMADIGTDHALLPVHLVQRGIVPKAVAGDLRRGPVQAAERQVREAGLTDRIDVRMGDGLSVLAPGEAATVVIAGMGGSTITDILNQGLSVLEGVRRLVLQPNVGERLVREWLISRGWKLTGETLLEEDGHWYEVLAADAASSAEEARRWNETLYAKAIPGYGPLPQSAVMLMGPYLLEHPNERFVAKWTRYIQKLDILMEELGKSNHPSAWEKREQLRQEQNIVKEVLAWASK